MSRARARVCAGVCLEKNSGEKKMSAALQDNDAADTLLWRDTERREFTINSDAGGISRAQMARTYPPLGLASASALFGNDDDGDDNDIAFDGIDVSTAGTSLFDPLDDQRAECGSAHADDGEQIGGVGVGSATGAHPWPPPLPALPPPANGLYMLPPASSQPPQPPLTQSKSGVAPLTAGGGGAATSKKAARKSGGKNFFSPRRPPALPFSLQRTAAPPAPTHRLAMPSLTSLPPPSLSRSLVSPAVPSSAARPSAAFEAALSSAATLANVDAAQLCSPTVVTVSREIAQLSSEKPIAIRQLPQPRMHGVATPATVASTAAQRALLADFKQSAQSAVLFVAPPSSSLPPSSLPPPSSSPSSLPPPSSPPSSTLDTVPTAPSMAGDAATVVGKGKRLATGEPPGAAVKRRGRPPKNSHAKGGTATAVHAKGGTTTAAHAKGGTATAAPLPTTPSVATAPPAPLLVPLSDGFVARRAAHHADRECDDLAIHATLSGDFALFRKTLSRIAALLATNRSETDIGTLLYDALLPHLRHALTYQFAALLFEKRIATAELRNMSAAEATAQFAASDFCAPRSFGDVQQLVALVASIVCEQPRVSELTTAVCGEKRSRASSVDGFECNITVLALKEPALLKPLSRVERNGAAFCQRLTWLAAVLGSRAAAADGTCSSILHLLAAPYYSKKLFKHLYAQIVDGSVDRSGVAADGAVGGDGGGDGGGVAAKAEKLLAQLLRIIDAGALASLVYYVDSCSETAAADIVTIVDRVAGLLPNLVPLQQLFLTKALCDLRLLSHLMRDLFCTAAASDCLGSAVLQRARQLAATHTLADEPVNRRMLLELIDLVQKKFAATPDDTALAAACYDALFRTLAAPPSDVLRVWLLSQCRRSTLKTSDVFAALMRYYAYDTTPGADAWQSLYNALMSNRIDKVDANMVAVAATSDTGAVFIQLPVAVRLAPGGGDDGGASTAVAFFDGVDGDSLRLVSLYTEPGKTCRVSRADFADRAARFQVLVRLVDNARCELLPPRWYSLAETFQCRSFDSAAFALDWRGGSAIRPPRFAHLAQVDDMCLERLASTRDLIHSFDIEQRFENNKCAIATTTMQPADAAALRRQQFVCVRHANVVSRSESVRQYVHKSFLKQLLVSALQRAGTVEEIVEQICAESGNEFAVDVVNFE